MRLIVSLFAAIALTAGAGGAHAAADHMFQSLPPAACAAKDAEPGKPIRLPDPLDEAARSGLLAGTYLSLYEPGVGGGLAKAVQAAPACPVARFAADDVVWTVHSDAASGIRWIKAPSREELFVVVKGPSLADAAAWNRTRTGAPLLSGGPDYYLISVAQGQNFVIQIYDGMPSAKALADDLAPLLEGETAPLSAHDPSGDAVTLFREVRGGAQADLFRPDELTGEQAAVIYLPDGRLFTQRGEDYVMRGSGFACRREYTGFKRDRLAISDPGEAGLELGCVLATDTGSTYVWVTRLPNSRGDKQLFEQHIRQAEQETGVAKKLSNPPSGGNNPISAGRNWIDKDGRVQVDFFLRQGEYAYEIRQSHTVDELEPASKTLMALIEQITAPPTGDPVTDWSRQR